MDLARMWRGNLGRSSNDVRAGRTLVRGATVITPGKSTSHLTLAMSPSTHWRTPLNQRPSYSTSTRSPEDISVRSSVQVEFGCIGKYCAKCRDGSNKGTEPPDENSTEGHFATTIACALSLCTRNIAGSGHPTAAESTSAPTNSHERARRST